MFTASYARLLTSFSRLRLELLLHSQAGDSDFCTWALKLDKILPSYPEIYEDMEGIIERGINEDAFLTRKIRLNAIASAIINYTSSCEYYLIDFINFFLKKDKRLLKRGLQLKDISINKFDIVEFNQIETLRNKYIDQLSGEYSLGKLWTKKIANATTLFDIDLQFGDRYKVMDSIWGYRNKLAHLSNKHHLPIKIKNGNGNFFQISDLSDDEMYLKFSLELVDSMMGGLIEVMNFEQKACNKWMNDFRNKTEK